MRLLFIILFMASAFALNAQTNAQIDSVANEMCNYILKSEGMPDTVRVLNAMEEFLFPFGLTVDVEKREDLAMKVFFRLQRNCVEFLKLLERINPSPNPGWQLVDQKPVSKLKKKQCQKILRHQQLTYLEPGGDTVRLELTDKFWVDHFKDGTYSRLKFEWVGPCEFEIEFVSSDNFVRKNFSNPGDKYRYLIIDRMDDHYQMAVSPSDVVRWSLFKIYFK